MNKKKQKKIKKNKFFPLLLVIIIVIVVIICTGVFSKNNSTEGSNNQNPQEVEEDESSKKDEEKDALEAAKEDAISNSTNTNKIDKLEEHVLENGKSVIIDLNNRKILIKNVDGKLYLDDQYIVDAGTCPMEFEYVEECSTIYETNKYILITTVRDTNEYSHIINENGEIVKIIKDTANTREVGINNLRLEGGKLVADEHAGTLIKTVEFFYKDGNMRIKYVS